MVVEIAQTLGGKPRAFDIFYNSFPKYLAKLGNLSPIETFWVKNRRSGISYSGEYAMPHILNTAPIRWLAHNPKSSRNCFIKKNSHNFGAIGELEDNKGSYYLIDNRMGLRFRAYHFNIDGNECISIFLENPEKQVGFVVTSFNAKYTGCVYNLYLLPELSDDTVDLLTVFVIYFNNWNNFDSIREAKSGAARKKGSNSFIEKYDSRWLTTAFPQGTSMD